MTLEEVEEVRVCESGNRVYPNQSIKSQKGTLDSSQVEDGKTQSFQVTIGCCVACRVSSEDEWGLWMGLSGSRERERK